MATSAEMSGTVQQIESIIQTIERSRFPLRSYFFVVRQAVSDVIIVIPETRFQGVCSLTVFHETS
ncbi:hypothetical protein CAEBREN_24953 [Caenorhabditis brenneri]|uniref:Uncharacterized protein n=1 Tax=Caenorhabditis brenneri TaxID=135651 RepID=G0MHT2_CAEBE|nr:hypothetical protein CAEBREN_24953 [Caenorhabditis brenneri]